MLRLSANSSVRRSALEVHEEAEEAIGSLCFTRSSSSVHLHALKGGGRPPLQSTFLGWPGSMGCVPIILFAVCVLWWFSCVILCFLSHAQCGPANIVSYPLNAMREASEPSISCDKSLTKKESTYIEHTIAQTEDPTHARHDDHLLHFVPGRSNVIIFRAGRGERRMMTPSLFMLIIERHPSSTSLIYVNNSMAEHR